jgi:hypothetical protein
MLGHNIMERKAVSAALATKRTMEMPFLAESSRSGVSYLLILTARAAADRMS